MNSSPAGHARFRRALLAWYDRHGRHDLPWQRDRDPYRVWLSEVMLQQTQVATVIPYFERFIARFPTIDALARARPDAVLHLWTGLGYYARARNLHRAARIVAREHRGTFPRDLNAIRALPGVGRSTAAAIAALTFGERHAILDGNVKRVLARYYAIDAPITANATEQHLWELAEAHTPRARVADYTQAIMDLGATVCRRSAPDCGRCPVRRDCRAYRAGNPQDYPVRTKRASPPLRHVHMLMIRDRRGRVLLQHRPPAGIWGGLWGFPECAGNDVRGWCRTTLGLEIAPLPAWPVVRHSFSHFQLDITPVPASLQPGAAGAMEQPDLLWYNLRRPDERGLPAPVERLLQQLLRDS